MTGESGKRCESAKIYACPEYMSAENKPIIMARVVCLPEFLKALKTDSKTSVDCSFAVIDPIIYQNSRVWRIASGVDETGWMYGKPRIPKAYFRLMRSPS